MLKLKDSSGPSASYYLGKLLNNSTFVSIVSAGVVGTIIYLKHHRERKRLRIAHHEMKKAQRKRAQRDEHLKTINIQKLDISEELVERILNADAVELLDMLQKKIVTSEEILICYFLRTKTIGHELELIGDVNFEEALLEARKCDFARKSDPSKVHGRLYGVPISIKDCFDQKGLDNTIGLAHRAFHPKLEDDLTVKLLREEGAIPFVRSNVPQLLFNIESNNHIWGSSKNPWNKEKTTGGSSGGEAGLIASRCSPLGIGTDIGGSIRIPAAWCGVCGFKPSSRRISSKLLQMLRSHAIQPSVGPIAKTVRDLNLVMNCLVNEKIKKWTVSQGGDPYYQHVPWDDEKFHSQSKGRIGYLKSHPSLPASKANQRAVELAIAALTKKGYEVVQIELPCFEELSCLLVNDLVASNLKGILSALNGEQPNDNLTLIVQLARMSGLEYKIRARLLKRQNEARALKAFLATKPITAHEYLITIAKIHACQAEFLKFWDDQGLEGLILPASPCPAFNIGMSKETQLPCLYSHLMNVLDIPCGVVPISTVQADETHYQHDLDMFDTHMKKIMAGSIGLPVAVQIATLPGEEESCLRIMRDVEEIINFREKHKFPL